MHLLGQPNTFLAKAMNMDDAVMPGHHAEAGCEGEVNHPTLVPAHVGQGEEGWYRSEFGCVAWSSFAVAFFIPLFTSLPAAALCWSSRDLPTVLVSIGCSPF